MITALMHKLFGEPHPCRGGWAESKLLGNCDAEPSSLSFPLQPLNAFSNFAYLVAGLVVLSIVQTPMALVHASAMGILCMGSLMYHGWPTKITNRIDHFGMHVTFATIAVTALGFVPWYLVGTVAVIAGVIGQWWRPDTNKSIAVLLAFTWLAMSFPGWVTTGWLSVIVFALAFNAWTLDRNASTWTGRWGHAAWHIGTAIAIGLLSFTVL